MHSIFLNNWVGTLWTLSILSGFDKCFSVLHGHDFFFFNKDTKVAQC